MNTDFEQEEPPLWRPATQIGVFRYNVPTSSGGDAGRQRYEPLLMVKCLSIHHVEGPQFSTAEFEYVNQNAITDQFTPAWFETVLPLISEGSDDTVKVDDRLLVVALTADGEDYRFLFDGFVTAPGTRFDGRGYMVGFSAAGVERRCWDEPLQDNWQRNCFKPRTAEKNNVKTGLPIRFNPNGKANCTPKDCDMTPAVFAIPSGTPDPPPGYAAPGGAPRRQHFPVFLDPDFAGKDPYQDDKPFQRLWSVSSAAQYIIGIGNPGEQYVRNPDFTRLDQLLDVYTPREGQSFVDINDPSTYDENPITIADIDVTGRPWPEELHKILDANGFCLCFRIGSDEDGDPLTYLDIYPKNDRDPSHYKDLFLDQWGQDLDPSMNNLAAADMQHDVSAIMNQYYLHTSMEKVEASFILAPLFKIDEADSASAEAMARFIAGGNEDDESEDSQKYRKWGVDEVGAGYWDMQAWAWKTKKPFEFTDMLPLIKPNPEATSGYPAFAYRPRPGFNQLLTKGPDNKPLSAKLRISFDYVGDSPKSMNEDYDSASHWFEIPDRSWNLLKDRLGIYIISQDPNAWKVGEIKGDLNGGHAWPLANRQVRCVEWLAKKQTATATAGGNFWLMLTCVIESDQIANIVSKRRSTSPTKFIVSRAVDNRMERTPKRIYAFSWYGTNDEDEGDTVVDFDKKAAQNYCDGKREVTQYGKFRLRAELPTLTDMYEIGDRIRKVSGRECSFAMNGGTGAETATYPKVIGITWSLARGEQTTLHLSDSAIVHRATLAMGRGLSRRR